MLKHRAKCATTKPKIKSIPKKTVKLGAAQVAAFIADQVKSDIFDHCNMITDCSLISHAQLPSTNTPTTKEYLLEQQQAHGVKESAAEMASRITNESDQSLWDDVELVNDNSNTPEIFDQKTLPEEIADDDGLLHETQNVFTGTAPEVANMIANAISVSPFQACTLISDPHFLNTSELRKSEEFDKSINLLPNIEEPGQNADSRLSANTDMKNLLEKPRGKAAEICGHLALSSPVTNTADDSILTDLSLTNSSLSVPLRRFSSSESSEKLTVTSSNAITGRASYIANIIANDSRSFGLQDTCLISDIYRPTKDTTTIRRSSTPGILMVDCAATNVQQTVKVSENIAYSLADKLACLHGTKEFIDCTLIDDKILISDVENSSKEVNQTLKVLPRLKSKAPQLASTLIHIGKANAKDDEDIFLQLTESRLPQKKMSLPDDNKTIPKTYSACLLANHFNELNPGNTIDNCKLVTDYSLINSAVQHYVIYARQSSNPGLATNTKSELPGTAPEIARIFLSDKGYVLNGDTSLVNCLVENDSNFKNKFAEKNCNGRKPETVYTSRSIPAPALAAKNLKEIPILDNHTLIADKQLVDTGRKSFNYNDDTRPTHHKAKQNGKLKGTAPQIAKLLFDKGLVVINGDTSLTEKSNQTTAYYKLDRKLMVNITLGEPEDGSTGRLRTTFTTTLIPRNTAFSKPTVSSNKVYPTEKQVTIVRIGGKPNTSPSTFLDMPSAQSNSHRNAETSRSTIKLKKTEDYLSTGLSRRSKFYGMHNVDKVQTRYTPTYMHINEDMYRSGYRLRSLGSASRVNIFDGYPRSTDYARRQLSGKFNTFSHSQENVRESNLRIYTYERAFSMNASLREARTPKQVRAFSLTGNRTNRSLTHLKSAEDRSTASSMSLAKETVLDF
ncbi:uncharacterized protein DEA37_0011332 [Paragonimus westermani]|uniref:Uncharacterized protein n=1 Tax=Paragonimus westermani TaxID=34504 RepID=A0A5J4NL97_9TREM|nr:uncharacterized protein DEA37_0011332 [Paragonimus westermani]